MILGVERDGTLRLNTVGFFSDELTRAHSGIQHQRLSSDFNNPPHFGCILKNILYQRLWDGEDMKLIRSNGKL